MEMYKGFNRDMTCNGFKFEEGYEYEENNVKMCESGFHACVNPVDIFKHYLPSKSIFREVELDDISDEIDSDSKRVGGKIKIGKIVDVFDFVDKSIKYFSDRVNSTGRESAVKTGDGSAVKTGYGSAVKTGYGSAVKTGDKSAVDMGYGSAVKTGDGSDVNIGDWSAIKTGDGSAVKAGRESAVKTGRGSAAKAGDSSVVCGWVSSRISGGINSLLAIYVNDGDSVSIVHTIVDGEKIKPGVFYEYKNGEFVESDNQSDI